MTRFAGLPVLFALIYLAAAAAAGAAEKQAQRWAQSFDKTYMSVNAQDPASAASVGRVNIKNISADIHFDPRDLKASRFWIGATFLPIAMPGNRPIDNSVLQEATGMFFSERIEKAGDNIFTVEGQFKLNGRMQPLRFPLSVTFDKTSASPRLVFRGQFNAPVGQLSPALGLPTQVPVSFYVEADPIP